MKTLTWTIWQTGGGCEALAADDGDCYWYLTTVDGGYAPDDEEPVLLGRYRTATGDVVDEREYPNKAAALAAVAEC